MKKILKTLASIVIALSLPLSAEAIVTTISNGGTGTGTAPTYGKVLIGNSQGKYDLISTSSLGISSGGATTTLLGDNNTLSGTNQFTGASTSFNKITFTNATGTQATTTNFFSAFISGTTAVFQNIVATASSTWQNFTAQKSTTTSATTTNFAVASGGSMNLFGVAGRALSDFCVSITGGSDLCDGNDATGGAGGSGNVATSSPETAGQVPYWTSTAGTPATLGSEAGFTYQESPTELVTMANGTVSGELRSNSLHETSAGIVGLNLDTANITAQIGSGGFFKLKDGTSAFELSIDTAALTANHALGAPDKDGTIAVLSDITNASSTIHTDDNTWLGVNVWGNSSERLQISSIGLYQVGTNYTQLPYALLGGSIHFGFDGAAGAGEDGSNIEFVASGGGSGNTNGGSLNFTSGLPSGTGATGTMKVYAGGDLIFEGASSTVATSTFYSNLHVKGGLKIGDASILLQGNSTSTFSKGIELTGGCFKVAGACLSSGGSGASSTMLTDNNTFSGANRFATLLVTGSSTLQNFTGINSTTSQATSTNFFSTNFFATKAVIGNATATGVIAVQGTGTSTYTGGIRALTAQFDALTAASCDLKADTSGNMYCGTDATGGAGGSSASTTSNFSIYKSGSTYYAYNASTTAVTSNASFSVLLQSVVDVMDAGKGGGSIYIQAGTYHVTSTTTIQGNGTAFDSPGGAIRIWGAGVGATKIVTTGNADFLAFDSVAVPMVSDLTVYMNGTSHAFYADSSNNAVRSMWMFYFANMQITSTSSAGAAPIYLGNALRGLFTNIEFTDTAGCAYYYAEGNWNPGDFTFTRSFCELQTTSNLVAFNFGSTTSGGYMNQVSFDMIESIATGVGQTFMRAAPVKFSSFTNLNAEQFDTLVDGYNVTMKNDWDFNYATHRTGIANLRGCRFGNTLNGVKGLAVLNTCTFKFLESDANFAVVDDMNTDTTAPNIIRGFFGSDAGTASASTSATTLTIFRDISFYGTLDNNLAPSGLAGVFQVYGPLQTRSSKTASSSIRSDATSTFQTGISISTGCFAIANVCVSGGSSASSTLLVNNNTFSGNNMFTGSSTILSFTALRSTTTAATTTDFTVTDAPIFSALSGLLKGNGSSPLTAAVDGTDFTLIDANTCGAGQHFNAVTAAGVFTCTADSGGGGGGSGIGWSWNSINSLYMSTSTDDLLLGASATSSTAKIEAINNGLIAWFASTTGATIRPIFTAFRESTYGKSGIGINSSSTEDHFTINGYANFSPQIMGCDLISSGGTLTTDQLAGQLCGGLVLDSVTDGGILQDTAERGVEANMPIYTIIRTGDTASWASNEGAWVKTNKAIPATTTIIVEAWLRNPNTNVATTTGTYVFGLGNVGAGSLTTTAAYAAPTNTCSFQASSTANWKAVVRKASAYNAWDDTGVSTSSTQSTFKRFRIQQDLVNGCLFFINGTLVASEPAATTPVVPMQLVLGLGNNGAGVGTIGTSQNHYFNFAELKMGWGRWQPK